MIITVSRGGQKNKIMKYLPNSICRMPTVKNHCTGYGFHYVSQNFERLEIPTTEGFGWVQLQWP
jgi:hypothetical protein